MFLSKRIDRGDVVRGVFTIIPSAVATQAIASAGADFVCLDREHGPVGRDSLHAMIAATAGTACSPLVRVPTTDEAEVKLALDAGAEGIVFPLVRSAEDVERAVALMTYPPAGVRGWFPAAAAARHGVAIADYATQVAPHLSCWVLIETVEAVEEIEAICAVEGVDVVLVAQFDLSTALGVPGDFEAPVFVQAVAAIESAARARSLPLGGIALTPERSAELVARGYRALVQGFDVLMLQQQVAAMRDWT